MLWIFLFVTIVNICINNSSSQKQQQLVFELFCINNAVYSAQYKYLFYYGIFLLVLISSY